MLLSPERTRGFLILALTGALLAGCDRQSGGGGQPQASDTPAAQASAPADPGGGGTGETASLLDRSHKGSPLPSLTLKDGTGKTLALPTLAGHPVLINLWATWCGPCVKELPQLGHLAQSGALRVVTISQDIPSGSESAPAKVTAFLKDKAGDALPAWLDPENAAMTAYGAQSLPTSVLYDAGGHEVWRVTGGRDWDSAASKALVSEAR